MPNYLGIDIGGTWIKGTIADERVFRDDKRLLLEHLPIEKIESPLRAEAALAEFADALKELISRFDLGLSEIKGIGISSAGIVNYHGNKILKAAAHLDILKNDNWKAVLEERLNCSAAIINDGDAATIGLAETGYLTGNKAVGIMPIGTGLGFTVWRNGRRWRPGKSLTLLGSIRTPGEMFDSVASASKLAAADESHDLIKVLTDSSYRKERASYLQNLVKVIQTAAILYTLDEVIICGGLADAASKSGFPLEKLLNDLLRVPPVEMDKSVKVAVAKEGNRLQLIGALALAKGEATAVEKRVIPGYKALATEIPYREDIQLQKMSSLSVIETMWRAEQEAGEALKSVLPIISDIADQSVQRIKAGGRMIYVGCGTSGRIAAMDAVEIPCTYGFPEDRIIALISGGISDAAIEIESDFEEDASSVPEMLLLNIQPEDVVIGISASGSAYYVQSALAFAKDRGALSVLIEVKDWRPEMGERKKEGRSSPSPASGLPSPVSILPLPFCDYVIPLNSGNEVVAGSTRMKAGTATKKVLNFLSSAIMIKLGKVAGPYMIDVACINQKLIERAQSILGILYGISKEDAFKRLSESGMNLGETIKKITG
jgi:N-acetylmuramic acid 6-phosphate (MurNAc-6-P) etherase/predicted NBD/HSP70 family sugar kinase